jgi:hypothetical protein
MTDVRTKPQNSDQLAFDLICNFQFIPVRWYVVNEVADSTVQKLFLEDDTKTVKLEDAADHRLRA